MLIGRETVWVCMCQQKFLFDITRGFKVGSSGLCSYSKMSPMIRVYEVFLLHNLLCSFSQDGCVLPSIMNTFQMWKGVKVKRAFSQWGFLFTWGKKMSHQGILLLSHFPGLCHMPSIPAREAGIVFLFLTSTVEEGKLGIEVKEVNLQYFLQLSCTSSYFFKDFEILICRFLLSGGCFISLSLYVFTPPYQWPQSVPQPPT